jgi:hypothetical protein
MYYDYAFFIVVLVVSYTLMAKSVRKEIMSFVVRKVRKQI